MMEQFRDCSSSLKVRKEEWPLQVYLLLFLLPFQASEADGLSAFVLVSVMPFCPCVVSLPTQNSVICCWGRQFPFVIPCNSLLCACCLNQEAQALWAVPRLCHCLTDSSGTEASLVSLPEVLQSKLKEQIHFHGRLNYTSILFSQGTWKERESWLAVFLAMSHCISLCCIYCNQL